MLVVLLSGLLFGCWTGRLQQTNGNHVDLTTMPIEELVDLEFVSVFKKRKRLFESPAAAYAITHEEIKRTGLTNIPDLLRMIPGMQVAQHNANSWAITTRGFSGLSRGIGGQFANKLLVLRDGRSVYTSLFSGVSWDSQDVLLDDVERVEVIRGPGATLWGANAVNGIINIITKNAHDTQGGLVAVGMGTEQRGFGHFRYGSRLGKRSHYRLYGKYSKVDDLVDAQGKASADGWHVLRGGFRWDWDASNVNMVNLQGDVYTGKVGQRYSVTNSPEPPFQQMFDQAAEVSGGNILGSWKHRFTASSDMSLQVYFDRVKREEAVVRGRVNTYDLDFQHRFEVGRRQEIIWGAGYRLVSDRFDSTFAFSLNPRHRNLNLFNFFLQDELGLITDQVYLTLGAKLEHNDYTGFELQPSARLLWTPSHQHTLWAALSRAVRTPSRGEDDARIVLRSQTTTAPTTFEVIFGNRDFASEKLRAAELGYRVRPSPRVSFDLAGFYNFYDQIRTNEPGPAFAELSPPPLHFVIPYTVSNGLGGKTFGLEAAADWQAFEGLRFRASYSFLKMQLKRRGNSRDTAADIITGQSPSHQFFLRSFMELSSKLDLDLRLRFVDSLPIQGVDSYMNLDARLGWQVFENLGTSLVGQNLLRRHRAENSEIMTLENVQIMTTTESSEVQRGVYVKFNWRF